MPQHLNLRLSNEIRATVGYLPPWEGDPTGRAIDYTGAPTAFAINATLLRGGMYYDSAGLYLPTPDTKALLVQRASGDGEEGSWSGVSGYIDVLHHPVLTDEAFDPVAAAARSELNEECGIPMEGTSAIDLHLGAVLRSEIVNLALGLPFEEARFNGHGKIRVAPILGMCYGPEPPPIVLKPTELSDYDWVPLGEIPNGLTYRSAIWKTHCRTHLAHSAYDPRPCKGFYILASRYDIK